MDRIHSFSILSVVKVAVSFLERTTDPLIGDRKTQGVVIVHD